MELPDSLFKSADIVAMAIDELYAAPGEAMSVGGAVGPAVQRQNAFDSRALQSVEPYCIVYVADRDIACDPVQVGSSICTRLEL
jgi:hypothetical protein